MDELDADADYELVDNVDVEAGLAYWKTQPANLDGVLGGFGSGVLVSPLLPPFL